MANETEFERLWRSSLEVQGEYPGAVFIGGLAVAAHIYGLPGREALAGETHDADLMLARADATELTEREALAVNRRLDKREFVRGDFAFDVYVQGEHRLAVPYEDAYASSEVSTRGLRVASWEHLLLLKSDAAAARHGVAPGKKDREDIVRLLAVGAAQGGLQAPPSPYWTPERLAVVRDALVPGTVALADGNDHVAARLRRDVAPLAQALADALASGKGNAPSAPGF